MNQLAEIKNRLELTSEAISRLERMLRDQPDSQGLLANMRTLEKTQRHLEEEFSSTAKRLGLEVCSYKLFQDGTDKQPIAAIGKALVNFQALF